jgi:hypothetical protein
MTRCWIDTMARNGNQEFRPGFQLQFQGFIDGHQETDFVRRRLQRDVILLLRGGKLGPGWTVEDG